MYWLITIVLCITSLTLTSCGFGNSLSNAGNVLHDVITDEHSSTNTGSTSNLGNIDDDFSDIGDDFADAESSEEYATLNNDFDNIQKLGIKPPSGVPVAYFDIIDSFRQSIKKQNIDNKDKAGKTALLIAIEKNDLASVQFLLDQGAVVSDEALKLARNSSNPYILVSLEDQK